MRRHASLPVLSLFACSASSSLRGLNLRSSTHTPHEGDKETDLRRASARDERDPQQLGQVEWVVRRAPALFEGVEHEVAGTINDRLD
jgi:hypothetical protein